MRSFQGEACKLIVSSQLFFFSAEPWIQPLGLPPKQPSKNGATPPRLPNMLQLPFRFWSYDFVVFWSERLWIVIGCICISQVFAAFNPFVSSIIARFLCFIQISNLSSQPWNFTIPTHHAVKIHHVHPSNNSRPKKNLATNLPKIFIHVIQTSPTSHLASPSPACGGMTHPPGWRRKGRDPLLSLEGWSMRGRRRRCKLGRLLRENYPVFRCRKRAQMSKTHSWYYYKIPSIYIYIYILFNDLYNII